jgi:hypothetical protein
VKSLEVEDVEPGGCDAREQEGRDVGSVERRNQLTDCVRGVVAADRTAGEDEPVDDPVGADDGAGRDARRLGVGKGDAERATPGPNRP